VGSLWFRAFPEDAFSGPIAPIALAEIDAPFSSSNFIDAISKVSAHESQVWLLNTDDEIVRIAVPSGAQTTEQVGVRSFQLSPQQRWLLWEDLAIVDDENPDDPRGELRARNLFDGREIALWVGHAYPWNAYQIDYGYIDGPDGWHRVHD